MLNSYHLNGYVTISDTDGIEIAITAISILSAGHLKNQEVG